MNYHFFNFKRFGEDYLLTNDFGNYTFVSESVLKEIVKKNINPRSELGQKLIEGGFIYEGSPLIHDVDQVGKLRNIKGFLLNATSLHIFVVTNACNLSCVYCQANKGKRNPQLMMTEETARQAVDIALQAPSRHLSFEFQGGEPLLNFPIIRYIVEYTEQHKGTHEIDYSIVSNLIPLIEEVLSFSKEYHISISTSLDGPENIHNVNRRFLDGRGSYSQVMKGIEKARSAGLHIGAIETTTAISLNHGKEIVKAYYDLGFNSVFIRPLTPLGRANTDWESIGYAPEEFLKFYTDVLEAAMARNREGYYFREEHAALFLRRIMGQNINYMELRSPCGAGIGQLAYYADGSIFTCDEARMVYEMGYDQFKLGTVNDNDYQSLISNSICKTVCASSVLESLPSCTDCVYQPYCGTCPVINYALCGDLIEKTPGNHRCRIYQGILDQIFSVLHRGDERDIQIFRNWSN